MGRKKKKPTKPNIDCSPVRMFQPFNHSVSSSSIILINVGSSVSHLWLLTGQKKRGEGQKRGNHRKNLFLFFDNYNQNLMCFLFFFSAIFTFVLYGSRSPGGLNYFSCYCMEQILSFSLFQFSLFFFFLNTVITPVRLKNHVRVIIKYAEANGVFAQVSCLEIFHQPFILSKCSYEF